MRKFDYSAFPGALLTPEISNLLSAIHEYRRKRDLYITAPKDILKTLLETDRNLWYLRELPIIRN